MSDDPFRPSFFEREDGSDDAEFYREPRLVAHIDDAAIEAVRSLYAELLPEGGAILDLMSSLYSHLPEERASRRVAAIGMNAEEMRRNRQVSEWLVRDINAEPGLPYADEEFDGAVVTVSAQYLTRPIEVFREVRRVLRAGAPFVVTYSNRMFPTKAVRIWRALDDRERATLIAAYFRYSGGWEDVSIADRSPSRNGASDPLYAVWARRTRG